MFLICKIRKKKFCVKRKTYALILSVGALLIYLNVILSKSRRENDDYDSLIICRKNVSVITVPKNVRKICSHSFSRCRNLTKIIFDENSVLESIGSNAFEFLSLKNIIVPMNVKTVEKESFYFCQNLESVEFLSHTLYINNVCFNLCKGL